MTVYYFLLQIKKLSQREVRRCLAVTWLGRDQAGVFPCSAWCHLPTPRHYPLGERLTTEGTLTLPLCQCRASFWFIPLCLPGAVRVLRKPLLNEWASETVQLENIWMQENKSPCKSPVRHSNFPTDPSPASPVSLLILCSPVEITESVPWGMCSVRAEENVRDGYIGHQSGTCPPSAWLRWRFPRQRHMCHWEAVPGCRSGAIALLSWIAQNCRTVSFSKGTMLTAHMYKLYLALQCLPCWALYPDSPSLTDSWYVSGRVGWGGGNWGTELTSRQKSPLSQVCSSFSPFAPFDWVLHTLPLL